MVQTVLQVRDLKTSLGFYTEVLGFAVGAVEAGTALLTGPEGAQVLLAGPNADLSGYEGVPLSGPGAWVYLHRPNLAELGEPVSPYPGYQQLQMTDPDGFVVTFWESTPMLDGEILAIYQTAPDRLEAALGFDYDLLDKPRAPGKWTVRQIVHHIVDSDMQTFRVIQMALALPGRQVQSDLWNPDDWMAALRCEQRDVRPALALFRASHDWVMEAVHALPDALDRWVSWPSGYRADVRQLMRQVGGHALHHIGQMEEVRHRHPLPEPIGERVVFTTTLERASAFQPLYCAACCWGPLPQPRHDTDICPCCGFEPICDVDPVRHRAKWLEGGARWFSRATPPPLDWELRAQLRRLGVDGHPKRP